MNAFRYTEGYRRGEVRAIWNGLAIAVLVVLGIAAFAACFIAVVLAISIPVGRSTCKNWAENTGVQTKFVRLNLMDTGTCLAKAPDGRWVKNTSVQVFIPGAKKK